MPTPFLPARPAPAARLTTRVDLHRSRTASGATWSVRVVRVAQNGQVAPDAAPEALLPGPAGAGPASARAAGGPPSAGRTASPGCRGTGPRASPPAGPWRPAARRRSASASPNGGARRASSSRRSGDSAGRARAPRSRRCPQPVAARLVERRRRTSSSSCLIIEPIRITLAGCSIVSRRLRDRSDCAPGHRSPARRARSARRSCSAH